MGSQGDTEPLDPAENESELDEPIDDDGLEAVGHYGDDDDRGNGDEQSDQDKWRRFGWAALIILTVGVAWALTLSTILINRSGDRTAELISLFQQGQQQRGAALGQTGANQQSRQAAVAAQKQQAQLYRAQQEQSNAEARQNLANAALASARARQADSQAALAAAQAARANRAAPSHQGVQRTLNANVEIQKTLNKTINALRVAIKKLPRR